MNTNKHESVDIKKLLDGVTVEWKALGEVTLPTSNIKWKDAKRPYRYIDLTSVDIRTKKGRGFFSVKMLKFIGAG